MIKITSVVILLDNITAQICQQKNVNELAGSVFCERLLLQTTKGRGE